MKHWTEFITPLTKSTKLKVRLLLLGMHIGLFSWSQKERILQFELTKMDPAIELDVFRFYATNVLLTYEDGTQFSPKKEHFLVDFSDRHSMKIPLDSSERRRLQKISFTLGTDSLTNVSGNFMGALDPIHGMYWAWNTGYMNLKLMGRKVTPQDSISFEYHLGGYLPPFPTVQTMSFDLVGDPDVIPITINVETFIEWSMERTSSVLIPGEDAFELSRKFKTVFSYVP